MAQKRGSTDFFAKVFSPGEGDDVSATDEEFSQDDGKQVQWDENNLVEEYMFTEETREAEIEALQAAAEVQKDAQQVRGAASTSQQKGKSKKVGLSPAAMARKAAVNKAEPLRRWLGDEEGDKGFSGGVVGKQISLNSSLQDNSLASFTSFAKEKSLLLQKLKATEDYALSKETRVRQLVEQVHKLSKHIESEKGQTRKEQEKVKALEQLLHVMTVRNQKKDDDGVDNDSDTKKAKKGSSTTHVVEKRKSFAMTEGEAKKLKERAAYLEDEMERLTELLKEATLKNEEKMNECKVLEMKVVTLEEEAASTKEHHAGEMEYLKERIADLEKRVADGIDDNAKFLLALKDQKAESDAKIKDMKDSLSKKDRYIHSLEDQNESAKHNLMKERELVARGEIEANSDKEIIHDLQVKVEQLEKMCEFEEKSKLSLGTDFKRVDEDLKELKSQHSRLKMDHESMNTQTGFLQKRAHEAESEVVRLKEELSNYEDQVKTLSQRSFELLTKLHEETNRKSTVENTVVDKEKELAELRRRNKYYGDKTKSDDKLKLKLSDENKKLQQGMKALKKEVVRLNSKLQGESTEKAKVETDAKMLKNKTIDLLRLVKEESQKRMAREEDIAVLNDQLKAVREKYVRMAVKSGLEHDNTWLDQQTTGMDAEKSTTTRSLNRGVSKVHEPKPQVMKRPKSAPATKYAKEIQQELRKEASRSNRKTLALTRELRHEKGRLQGLLDEIEYKDNYIKELTSEFDMLIDRFRMEEFGKVKALVQYLELKVLDTSTDTISLPECYIGDEGAAALANTLENVKHTRKLDLIRNGIGAAGLKAFQNFFSSAQCPVTTLILKENSIDEEACSILGKILKVNSSIGTLDLSWNRIDDNAVIHISTALQINKTISTLILQGNNISDRGVEHIAESLKNNGSVTTLDLSQNRIGPQGVRSISEALTTNFNITQVDLGNPTGIDENIKSRIDGDGDEEDFPRSDKKPSTSERRSASKPRPSSGNSAKGRRSHSADSTRPQRPMSAAPTMGRIRPTSAKPRRPARPGSAMTKMQHEKIAEENKENMAENHLQASTVA